MTTHIVGLPQNETPWLPRTDPVCVGKDILELLSSSMYISPITIYREYVQNSADAIDEARSSGLLQCSTSGRVEIDVDPLNRVIRIRDDGTGIPRSVFASRLTAFGASAKRDSHDRGFRGVGRLAGIGYCQELVFRSRSSGESRVSELRWDCRKIKAILTSSDSDGDLSGLVNQSVATREIDGSRWPDHFFEVELRNVVRHRNDCLLNAVAVGDYLSQVAPVPFAPNFRFREEIKSALCGHVALGDLDIRISGLEDPIYRPHHNCFEIAQGTCDDFTELEFVQVPGADGGTAALGWVLHHNYKGAIPARTKIRGLRLRSGNIQVGDSELLEELFPEPRFNSWSVGEVHVVDDRIVPNGRRDHFEQNVHYYNLISHISPVAREISTRCRTSSLKRNWLREFKRHELTAKQNMTIVRQGSLGATARKRIEGEIALSLYAMEKIACRGALARENVESLQPTLTALRRRFTRLRGLTIEARSLAGLPSHTRRAYERVFALIYECSPNVGVAKALVDRVLSRLT